MKVDRDKFFADQRDEVPQEVLLRYVSGIASPEEIRWVEEKMVDDPFLADAVEGMLKVKNEQALKEDLVTIHAAMKERTAPRIRIFNSGTAWLKVAAALCLLISAIWFVNSRLQQSTEKIFTHEFEPYPAPTATDAAKADNAASTEFRPLNDTLSKKVVSAKKQEKLPAPQVVEPSVKYTTESTTDAAPEISLDENEVAERAMAPQEDIISDATAGSNAKQEADQVTDKSYSYEQTTAESVGKPSAATTRKESMQDEVKQSVAEKDGAFKKKNEFQGILDAGLAQYHDANYADAIKSFEAVLKMDGENETAIFYAGVSYLALENADEALVRLKKLENNKSGDYYEPALWYEALAYVQKGEKKNAESILNKVIRLNGEHRKQAEELLLKL